MKKNKLNDKYTDKELAESFVFRNKLTSVRQAKSDAELSAKRKELRKFVTPKQVLLSRLLQLKYQIEDYLESPDYDTTRSFGFFLRGYLETLNKKSKEFANDIDIAETELSQILNKHRNPSEKVIIRLELHSNKIIPAIMWHRLVEKEKEHEILTNTALRTKEREHVRNAVVV